MDKITNHTDKQTVTTYAETFVKALIENGEPTGIDLDIETFMLGYVENNTPSNELISHIHQLMLAVFSDNYKQTEDVLHYFLGRGKGATPSGDDHVIGLLAIHALTNAFHPVFIETVNDLTKKGSITTNAGLFYLRHALKGEFLPPIALIINSTGKNKQTNLREHITNLLPLGHSSGIDTTFGMLLGILALK